MSGPIQGGQCWAIRPNRPSRDKVGWVGSTHRLTQVALARDWHSSGVRGRRFRLLRPPSGEESEPDELHRTQPVPPQQGHQGHRRADPGPRRVGDGGPPDVRPPAGGRGGRGQGGRQRLPAGRVHLRVRRGPHDPPRRLVPGPRLRDLHQAPPAPRQEGRRSPTR